MAAYLISLSAAGLLAIVVWEALSGMRKSLHSFHGSITNTTPPMI